MDGIATSRRLGAERVLGFNPNQFFRSEVVRFAVLPSACAWLAFLVLPLFGAPADICSARPAGSGSSPLGYLIALWCLMVVAMMLPLSAPQLKIVAARSAPGHKGRSVAIFVVGFVVAWACAGFAVTATMQLSGLPRPSDRVVTTLLYLVAMFWQVSITKKRALNRCHFIAPIRTWGLAADLDALRNGLRHGRYCVGSCVLTMLPLSASGQGTAAMAVFFALILAERVDHRPKLGMSVTVIFLLWANEML